MGISVASLFRVAASVVDTATVPQDVAVLKWQTVVCILQMGKLRLCVHHKMACNTKCSQRALAHRVCAVEEANVGEGLIHSIGFLVKCPASHSRGIAALP